MDAAPADPAAPVAAMPARVLLVHGLWMPPLAMRRVATRLRALGFATETVGYRSIVGSTGAAVARIRDRLRGAPPTHVVGHSLGGCWRSRPCAPNPACRSGAWSASGRRCAGVAPRGRCRARP